MAEPPGALSRSSPPISESANGDTRNSDLLLSVQLPPVASRTQGDSWRQQARAVQSD